MSDGPKAWLPALLERTLLQIHEFRISGYTAGEKLARGYFEGYLPDVCEAEQARLRARDVELSATPTIVFYVSTAEV